MALPALPPLSPMPPQPGAADVEAQFMARAAPLAPRRVRAHRLARSGAAGPSLERDARGSVARRGRGAAAGAASSHARALTRATAQPRSARRRGAAADRRRDGQARRRRAEFLLRYRSGAAVSASAARPTARARSAIRNSSPRLGQALIRLLEQPTADGFVFRVDLRLRPFGDSGPLVSNAAALEDYLQIHGRDWERYAWVKARAITDAERLCGAVSQPRSARSSIGATSISACSSRCAR